MTVIKSKTPGYWLLIASPAILLVAVVVAYAYVIWFNSLSAVFRVLAPIFVVILGYVGYVGITVLLKNGFPT